ncbi:QRFP-like peptide receptor [Tubulanus polymorphus]|uniref:QRFP-like peptide receptor n=1 Tax=Tubulanus polymorphus TaxID=672921 RepID=UPI003DA303E9
MLSDNDSFCASSEQSVMQFKTFVQQMKLEITRTQDMISTLCEKLMSKDENFTQHSLYDYCLSKLAYNSSRNSSRSGEGFVDMPDMSSTAKLILLVLYSLVFISSLTMNVFVLVSYAKCEQIRRVTNAFVVSLSVSDLLITLAILPVNMVTIKSTGWSLGGVGCKAIPFLQTLSVTVSCLTLCCIAAERYYAIMCPLESFKKHTFPQATILLFIAWIVSFFNALPNAIFYDFVPTTRDKGYCLWDPSVDDSFISILSMLLLFLLPSAVMTAVYVRIGWHLWTKQQIGNSVFAQFHKPNQQRRQIVRIFIRIVTLFAISFCPISIFNVVCKVASLNYSIMNLTVKNILIVLALGSTCLNPVIYTLSNKRYRNICARKLCCKTNKNHLSTTSASMRNISPLQRFHH